MGAAGTFAAFAGTAQAAALELTKGELTRNELTRSQVSIATPHGPANGWFVRPASGQHPGVVMWPDAAGLRSSTQAIASQLAEQGYSVLVVDRSYHRAIASAVATGQGNGVHADQLVSRDARAFVAWLNGQETVQPAIAAADNISGIGNGYSLRSISAAQPRLSLATRSERVAAARSAYLFAVPEATVARSPALMAKLHATARLLYRAAGPAVAAA